MNGFRIIVRNVLSNWLGFLVQAGLTFVLTPFVLQSLGETRYGVWLMIVGLTGYYGLLDLGFRTGLTQFLARHLAVKDYDAVNRIASSGWVGLTCCGILLALASAVLGWLTPALFHLPDELSSEVQAAVWILGLSVAVQFFFFPFSALFVAAQRFDLSNGITIATRLVSALATVMVLRAGFGLIGLSLVTAFGNLLDYSLRWRLAYAILPQLNVSVRRATRACCWDLVRFGAWNLLNLAGTRIIQFSDTIVAGIFLPAAALAPLGLAVSLVTYFSDLFNPVCQVFLPAAARLDARGEIVALRRLYLQGSQIVLLLAAISGVAADFWAEDFIRLWLGAADGSGIISARTADLFPILLGAGICTVSRGIGRQIFLGTGRLHTLGLLLAGEAVVNLALSVLLAPVFGLKGIVLGTLIPAVLFQAILHPWLLGRCLGITFWRYAAQVYVRPLAAALLVSGGAASIRVLGPADSWQMLGLQLSCLLALAAPAAIVVGLGREQRDTLLGQLPNRLAWSLGKAH